MSPEEIIAIRCPALSGSPSLQGYLKMAFGELSRKFYGVVYNKAVALKAMHEYTVDQANPGSAGEALIEMGGGAKVASVSEVGISVSFAQSASGTGGGIEATLSDSKFGRELAELKKGRLRIGISA